MNKMIVVFMAVLFMCSVSIPAFADEAAAPAQKNPVQGFVEGTGEVIAGIGEGTGKCIAGFGKGTGEVVNGMGQGVQHGYEGVTGK